MEPPVRTSAKNAAPQFAATSLTRAEVRRIPAAKRVLKRWRELVPRGERTLIACSGGADSTALVLMLAAATGDVVVGHVVHDMRAEREALADRDFVRSLAERCGVAFIETSVHVPRGKGAGNAEANARRARYAALSSLAEENKCGFVATAHHADDQMESMLMALVRGAGTAGMRGLAERRVIESTYGCEIALVRPMLGVTHAENVRLCETLGVEWREDATNGDVSRLRSALRTHVLPVLEEIRPGASRRAARTAVTVRGAHRLLLREAQLLLDGATVSERPDGRVGVALPRGVIRGRDPVIIGEAIRLAVARHFGGRALDSIGAGVLERIVRAAVSQSGETKGFKVRGGIRIEIRREHVCITGPRKA